MPHTLVAGSIAYDVLLQYDGSFADGIDPEQLEQLSLCYVTRRLKKHFGGTAANVAWNFRLLNQPVSIAGSVGTDGQEYIQRLDARGIDVSLVQHHDDDVTPTAIIGTDSSERQVTFFHPGADQSTKRTELSSLAERPYVVLISPHSATAMELMAQHCIELQIPYIFDPGQQIMQFGDDTLKRLIRGCDGLIANAYEWSLIADRLQWTKEDVLEQATWLVVTQGEHGVGIQTHEESLVVDAVPVEHPVNPTGAGDAFRAGFLTGLQSQWSLTDAAKLGAALAAYVVELEGTQLEEFSIDALRERVLAAYGAELPMF